MKSTAFIDSFSVQQEKISGINVNLSRNLHVGVLNQNITITKQNIEGISVECRRYAGHSKWKNIKATKEARDSQRQKMITGLVRRMKTAVTLCGGETNPKFNLMLSRILEEGKAKDVPSATMNRTLERLAKGSARIGTNPSVVEARAVTGVSYIIETFSERPKYFRQQVQSVMKTHGGTIAEMGVCSYLYDRKGAIYVHAVPMNQKENAEFEKLEFEKVFELAIEAGAEEVFEDVDENNEQMFKFVCDMKEFNNVKKYIEGQGIKPFEARLEYLPQTRVKLEGEALDLSQQIVYDLEALEETETVFHNIEPIIKQ